MSGFFLLHVKSSIVVIYVSCLFYLGPSQLQLAEAESDVKTTAPCRHHISNGVG